jgi:hypothetical protein
MPETGLTTPAETGLTKEDCERLEELVAVVNKGMMSFVAVGNALAEINARHLYRITGHDSFSEFCRDRWCISRQRAWQLMNSAGVAKILDQENPATAERPASESQARVLSTIKQPTLMADVWTHSVDTAPVNARGQLSITAPHIERCRAEMMGETPGNGQAVVAASKPSTLKDKLGRFVEPKLGEAAAQGKHLAQLRLGVLAQFSAEVDGLAEKPGGAYIDQPEIRRLVELLESVVRFAEFYTTCPDCRGDVGNTGCETCGGSGFINKATFNRLTDEQNEWLTS